MAHGFGCGQWVGFGWSLPDVAALHVALQVGLDPGAVDASCTTKKNTSHPCCESGSAGSIYVTSLYPDLKSWIRIRIKKNSWIRSTKNVCGSTVLTFCLL